LSSALGHRLFARLTAGTTDWRHIGTVESVDARQVVLMVAMRDGGRDMLDAIGLSSTTPRNLAQCFVQSVVETSPLLKLEPTDHFCLDLPMGPGVGDFHNRETQRINLAAK